MVDSKRYNPSNKRFQEHTKSFIEGTTRKGHLDSKGGKKDKYKTMGELIRVTIANIRGDGWYCKVDEEGYLNCNYGDNVVFLPPHTVSANGMYYIPKSKCEVEISVDKNTKMHTITKINDPNKQVINISNDGVVINGSGDAKLSVEKDNVVVEGDIKIDTSKMDDIDENEISLTDLYKQVQEIRKS